MVYNFQITNKEDFEDIVTTALNRRMFWCWGYNYSELRNWIFSLDENNPQRLYGWEDAWVYADEPNLELPKIEFIRQLLLAKW